MRNVLRKWFARGNTDLFLHQIASVNLLRDGVLDLDASVHLDKKEMAVLIDQELDCSRVFVSDRLGQLNGSVSHFFAQTRRHERRRTFLDHLLVTPLDGTIAFAQMNRVTMTVSNNLKFDVMWIDNELLEIDLIIPESFLSLVTRTMKG